MATVLSHHTNGRNNNFTLLRFLGAILVLFTHAYALTGNADDEPMFVKTGYLTGDFAVNLFFVTSGFLITKSLFNRKNLIEFFWARVLRVYPALIAAVLFCAFPLGLLFTKLSAADYLTDKTIYSFVLNNATLLAGPIQYHLPGVFMANPWKYTVNGSIWTLIWEMRLYAAMVMLALLAWRRRASDGKRLEVFIVALGLLYTLGYIANRLYLVYHGSGVNCTLRFFSLFFVGGSFYVYRERIVLSHRVAAVMMVLLVLFAGRDNRFFLLVTLFLPYLVLYLAYKPGGWLLKYNRLGDYSYGTYLYGFPLQQGLAAAFPGIGIAGMFFASVVITVPIAVLSWHLLEKYMMSKKEGHIHFTNALARIRLSGRIP
jgi:peptidoglycan/LPS O-acetylase OafA/YrhL